jgi:hypothetical protein
MNDSLDPFSQIWDDLLSCQPEKIKNAYSRLATIEQKLILEHLQEMAEGEGWQPTQKESAEAALITLLAE